MNPHRKKITKPVYALVWIIFLGSSFSPRAGAAQFVELTADIQTVRWSDQYKEKPPSVQVGHGTVRCVVGTNSWLIERDSSGISRDAWWFTGSNVIAHTLVLKYPSDRIELFERNHPGIVAGHGYTKIRESRYGEPPLASAVIVGDAVLGGTAQLNLAWLAFCSGPYLKTEGHWISAPSMEQMTMYSDQTDTTISFNDALGLPISWELYSTNQPLCHYRTVGSTNVLGWNFPLEFYMTQYRRNYQTGVWQVHMTACGKLAQIGPGREPSVPIEGPRDFKK